MSDQAQRRVSIGVIIAVVGWIVAGVWWASRIEAQVLFMGQALGELKSDVRLLLDGQRMDRLSERASGR